VKTKGVTAIRNPTSAEPKPKPKYTASRMLKIRAARVKYARYIPYERSDIKKFLAYVYI
jgi:hypothetical protein